MNFRRLLLVVCFFFCHLSFAQEMPDTTLGTREGKSTAIIRRVDPLDAAKTEMAMHYLQFGRETFLTCQVFRGILGNAERIYLDSILYSDSGITGEPVPFLTTNLPNENPLARLTPWNGPGDLDHAPLDDPKPEPGKFGRGRVFIIIGGRAFEAPWSYWASDPYEDVPDEIHSCTFRFESTNVYPFVTIKMFDLIGSRDGYCSSAVAGPEGELELSSASSWLITGPSAFHRERWK